LKNIELFIISICDPLLCGIYEDGKLIKKIELKGKTTDLLPLLFEDLLKSYTIKEIYYVNGPGSYMSIKISYLFLKTFCIVNDISLQAASGFLFNNNSPIKSLGKKYFFNTNDDKIRIDFLKEEDIIYPFSLPETLNKDIFSDDIEPSYNLPAVN